ncbi:cytochrome P450 [Trametes versicolor FP-101664 SS1]|uniref:cytochrome P450 n=1 Tax=Trametes versicolor (strain FP-101664) TaxID=717944 RepID=UPI00046248F3|nr:cytochrome P450 [Trametes versicolor FP-101664 SS1]EIW55305.1 cytochrome P450 [Trametes versicolor FP-101664 SS1]
MAFITAQTMQTALLVVALTLAMVLWKRKAKAGLPLPPGPRPLPFIGNLFDMPTKHIAPALREIGSRYGELTYLNMLGQPIIILNSYEAAIGLLEGRSANTSDRPRLVMAELTGYMYEFAVQGYTQEWRIRRRLFHTFFQPSAIPQYHPVHVRECQRFRQRLLATPEEFLSLARHATIMDVVYGITVTERDDPYVSLAQKATIIFSRIVVPGQYLVEVLPFLKHVPSQLPGAGFKRQAKQWSKTISAARNTAYDATLDAFDQGAARPSIVTSLVENAMSDHGKVSPQDDEYFRDVTGLAYLTYPEPDAFIPERFMKDGTYGSDIRDPETYQFGFGRRICPGRHFANDALFITVASVLHVFNIEPPLGPDGEPLQIVPHINLDSFLSYACCASSTDRNPLKNSAQVP